MQWPRLHAAQRAASAAVGEPVLLGFQLADRLVVAALPWFLWFRVIAPPGAPALPMSSLSTPPASRPVPPALPTQHTRLLHWLPVYHHLRVDSPAPGAHGPAPVPSLRLPTYTLQL